MVWLITGWFIFIFAWMWFAYEQFLNHSKKETNGWILLFVIQTFGLIAVFAFEHFQMFFVASLTAAFYVKSYFGKSLI